MLVLPQACRETANDPAIPAHGGTRWLRRVAENSALAALACAFTGLPAKAASVSTSRRATRCFAVQTVFSSTRERCVMVSATLSLGVMYAHGKSVPQNYALDLIRQGEKCFDPADDLALLVKGRKWKCFNAHGSDGEGQHHGVGGWGAVRLAQQHKARTGALSYSIVR
jgi:hypothetical protein